MWDEPWDGRWRALPTSFPHSNPSLACTRLPFVTWWDRFLAPGIPASCRSCSGNGHKPGEGVAVEGTETLSLVELTQRLHRRDISPVELMKWVLERIEVHA